jgi:hypothetical protein
MKKLLLLLCAVMITAPLFAQQLNKAESSKKPGTRPAPVQVSPSKEKPATKDRPAQIQATPPAVAPMQQAGKEKPVTKESSKEESGNDRKMKKDGTPDKRFKENKKLRKDGKPDLRYKQNKEKGKGKEKKHDGK